MGRASSSAWQPDEPNPPRAGSQQEVGFYEIRLQGHLDPRWATRLEVLSLTHEGDGTTAIRVAPSTSPPYTARFTNPRPGPDTHFGGSL